MKQQTTLLILTSYIFILTGCQNSISNITEPPNNPTIYSVTVDRTTTVNMKGNPDKDNLPQIMEENMDLVLSVKPNNNSDLSNSYHIICKSVKLHRSDFAEKKTTCGPLKSLRGKHYNIEISPDSQIIDASLLKNLLNKASEKVTKQNRSGRFKEHSDMLLDYYIINSSLCEMTAKAVSNKLSQGYTWNSTLATPSPAVEFQLPTRKISSEVKNVFTEDNVNKAKIIESYTTTKGLKSIATEIYPKNVKTKGLFTMLRNWRNKSLTGQGETIINLDSNTIESIRQQWQTTATASLTIPIKGYTTTDITIDQTITINEIDDTIVSKAL